MSHVETVEHSLALDRQGRYVRPVCCCGWSGDRRKVKIGQEYAVTQWEATRNDTVAIFSTLSDLRRWLHGLELSDT